MVRNEILLDEDVLAPNADHLKRRHNVRHAAIDYGHQGRDDRFHHQQAKREGRILITFRTAADFYEAKIIASTTGWRRITREGEERGEWEVVIREEGIEYSAVEAIEVGIS